MPTLSAVRLEFARRDIGFCQSEAYLRWLITTNTLELVALCILKSEAEHPHEAAKILMRVILHRSAHLAHLDQDQEEGLQIKLYLSYSYFFYEMGDRHVDIDVLRNKKDEYDIDFEDTSAFAVERYKDILLALDEDLLSPADRNAIRVKRDWQTLQAEIQRKRLDPTLSATSKRLINQFQPLPRTLNELTGFFQHAVQPFEPPMEQLWGLVHLNFKLSYESPAKLRKTTEWVGRLRRVVELFNRCIDACKDEEINEVRIAIVEGFTPLLSAFADSIAYLRTSSTDLELNESWPAFDEQINMHISELDGTVKHLNDITNLSSVNRERIQRNLAVRHAAIAEPEETAKFPIQMLPHRRNPRFYGREAELDKINKALDWNNIGNAPLRTYTIYGRRGVGKTELALEYAHANPARFDAIFWVGCETGLYLRQSFTDIANEIRHPGADKHGHHEENQLAVIKWLKKTKCRWLMIFDNAEKEHLLKGYWPMGANGAILITSRQFYNFMQHEGRKGDTVKAFDPEQSFDLLFQLLGDDWRDLQKRNVLPPSEVKAAKEFLGKLEGLGLAIQQAAILIKNDKIGGPRIETTYEMFKDHARNLPERQLGKRSDTYHSLDTLWDMNFKQLSKNARSLLSVLSLLSPDTTYIELFLPRRQAVLDGKLSFCKQKENLVDGEHNTLTNILAPTQDLERALEGLGKAELIRRDGRVIYVHRVVQEAMNYQNLEDLQESFDAAVGLVAEAFPRRRHGISLFEQWPICSLYIHDGVHLVHKFSEYTRPPIKSRLKGTNQLVELIGHLAWYLYEISDYDGALQIIEVGYTACRDKESLLYADLCNIAGVCYTEKNFLPKCREVLEKSLRIREQKLSPKDIDIAASTHNMGNLETATGDFDKAMEYFDRAVEIRLAQGDTAANQLALLYLCIARVHTERKEFDKAVKMLSMAENLFVRQLGAEKHYMAHVHYAYGNLECRTSNWLAARQSYTVALRIALAETPIHPITAAAYLSLGQVEYKLKNNELAKSHLEKAKSIAELRSPRRDDGTTARILYVLHQVMSEDLLMAADAEELRVRAEIARTTLINAGESAEVDAYDVDGNLQSSDEAKLYDALVPIFFR